MAYLVYQTERGAQGTIHLQGYVRFNNKKRLLGAKALIHPQAHLEIARGTEAQNKAYCTKTESQFPGPHGEYGTFLPTAGIQGKRTDLDKVTESIKGGATYEDIADQYPREFIKFTNGIRSLIEACTPLPPVSRTIQCWVLWGATGTGKSHRVRTEYPDAFLVLPGRDPWDGYTNQKVIIMEEFNWEDWPINTMKQILDKWRYRLQRRYHNGYALWEKVFILTNSDPLTWYPNAAMNDLNALRRRLNVSCRHVVSIDGTLQDILMNQFPSPLLSFN